MQEICTLGSAWGDEFKKPRSLGEGTGAKASDNSEAPQRATASRLVSTILWFDLRRAQVMQREYQLLDYAFDRTMTRSKTDRISHRMAAMAIGVEKGRNAMNLRGLFP